MTRHVIKIDASSFNDVRSGRQTCLIHRNDRLWNPGDEIWFAECDGDPLILNRDGRPYCCSAGGQFTGSVIRQLIIFTEFGGLGLEKGYVALYLQPLHRRLEKLPVETFTKAQITGVRYASRPVFGNLHEHPEWDPELGS